jgi:hypothetical protein
LRLSVRPPQQQEYMIASRARTGLLALFVLLLAACGGSSLPGIPSPTSGISALTDVYASHFGLPAGVADEAVGGMLSVANNVLPEGTWSALAGNIPGAEELVELTRDGLPDGSPMESLDDVGTMLGAGAGVNASQLAEMGSMMESYLSSAVEDEAMRSQIENIFG